jgi:hypothetical protein
MKALSFDSEQITNNSINKVIEEKTKDHFLLLEEHLFATVLLNKTNYEVQFEDMLPEVLEFFLES